VLHTAVALALVAAALAAAFGPAGRRAAVLAFATAFCWSSPVLSGWADGPPSIRGLGALAAPFLLPLVVQWALGSARARPARAARVVLVVAYAQAAVVASGQALFHDPSTDPDCWDNCVDNISLARPMPTLVDRMELAAALTQVGVGLALTLLATRDLWAATLPARRLLWPAGTGGMVAGAAVVAHAYLVIAGPERPADPAFFATYLGLALAVLLLACGPVLAQLRLSAQRRDIARIAAEVGAGPQPGAMEAALARAVGDPGLRIAYWVRSSGRYVDGTGRPVGPPAAEAGEQLTPVVRDGRTLATITHVLAATAAVRALGAGTELALDNERMRAELLAQAADIRASRERIVEAADAGRHRLERDLHDGAQQRLLALTYHLRLALAAADAEGDKDDTQRLRGALDESLQGLEELRGLAHGIYPAVLAQSGLGPALAGLGDTSPVPVSLALDVDGRLALAVETATFVAVREAVDDAVSRAATGVAVRVTRCEDRVVIAINDDGRRRTSTLQTVADRVGALGGALSLGPDSLRAALPCG
jgi:signal transduction histidine kinase